jgi:hypothetical protein
MTENMTRRAAEYFALQNNRRCRLTKIHCLLLEMQQLLRCNTINSISITRSTKNSFCKSRAVNKTLTWTLHLHKTEGQLCIEIFHRVGTSHKEVRTYGKRKKQQAVINILKKKNRRPIYFTALSASRLWRRIVQWFRIRNHKAFRSTRSWANRDTIQDISWNDWEQPRQISVSMASNATEIWTEHFPVYRVLALRQPSWRNSRRQSHLSLWHHPTVLPASP